MSNVEYQDDFDEVEFSIDFATAANMMIDKMSYEDARKAAIEEYNEYRADRNPRTGSIGG